jgi:hypothetical protein
MNRLELRTDIRVQLREVTAAKSQWLDANLNRFIYKGIRDMCIKAGVLEKTRSITVSTTVAAYAQLWDFLKPVTLLNASGVPIDSIQRMDTGKVFIITGKPLYFYVSETDFTPVTRVQSTLYAQGVVFVPAIANGFMYEVTATGTSKADPPPTFGTDIGGTTTDGTATITCRELISRGYTINLWDTPTTAGGGTGTYTLIYKALSTGWASDTVSTDFPVDYHHALIDYVCWEALISLRQFKDAAPFIMNYCRELGLDLKDYLPVGGQ